VPAYSYKCNKCESVFELRHSYKDEIYKKPDCDEGCELERLPTIITINDRNPLSSGTGDEIKKVIEETRHDIESTKKSRINYET